MKSLFEEMGGTYRQEGDYLIPNLALPDEPEYQIGKYGRMRRSYLKEHRPVLYASLLTSGTLHRHLAEIGQACNERMAIIVSDMARQEDVTEALKTADQMEWVRRMNNIHSRADRGLTEQPTVHEGVVARALEKKGIISDRCEINRQIKADNALLRELKATVKKMMQAVKNTVPAIAEAMEKLRKNLLLFCYQLGYLRKGKERLNTSLNMLRTVQSACKRHPG